MVEARGLAGRIEAGDGAAVVVDHLRIAVGLHAAEGEADARHHRVGAEGTARQRQRPVRLGRREARGGHAVHRERRKARIGIPRAGRVEDRHRGQQAGRVDATGARERFQRPGLDRRLVGADALLPVRHLVDALVVDHEGDAVGLVLDGARDRVVVHVDRPRRLVDEAPAVLVDQQAVREAHHQRLDLGRARIHRLGMVGAEVAGRRAAGIERHADALAAVVVAAARHRPQVARLRADVAREHLGVALEAARAQHHAARHDAPHAAVGPDRVDRQFAARVGAPQLLRGAAVADRHAQAQRFVAQRLDQREAAAHRHQPRRGRGHEVGRQRREAHAEALQPPHRGAGLAGQRGDQLGVGHAVRLDVRRPVLVGRGRVLHDLGIDVVAGIGHQQLLEIVADLGLALHAEVGLGPARVAAELLGRGAFQHRHGRARGGRGHRRAQARDAAADDEHVAAVDGQGCFVHVSTFFLLAPACLGLSPLSTCG